MAISEDLPGLDSVVAKVFPTRLARPSTITTNTLFTVNGPNVVQVFERGEYIGTLQTMGSPEHVARETQSYGVLRFTKLGQHLKNPFQGSIYDAPDARISGLKYD